MNKYTLIIAVAVSLVIGWYFGNVSQNNVSQSDQKDTTYSVSRSSQIKKHFRTSFQERDAIARSVNISVNNDKLLSEKLSDTVDYVVSRREREVKFQLDLYLRQINLTDEESNNLKKVVKQKIEEDKERVEQLYRNDSFKNNLENLVFVVSPFQRIKEILDEAITDENAEKYNAFLEKELVNRIESESLGRLAELQRNIHLSEQEKDEAYNGIYDEVEKSLISLSLQIEAFDGHGKKVESDVLGTIDFLNYALDGEVALEEELSQEKAQIELLDSYTESRLNIMQKILPDDQAVDYVAELRRQVEGFVNAVYGEQG